MIEHLSNCHGEWNALLAIIGSIPFIGAWLRLKLNKQRRRKAPIGNLEVTND